MPAERRLLASEPWGVSAIELWEIAKIRQSGRIDLDITNAEFSRIFAKVHIWPLDIAVCRTSTELDFTCDPADGLIAVTSIVHRVPLVTRDKKIQASKLVPIAR